MSKCKCPIDGCDFKYTYGILGWDSHVARLENHPNYHPKVVTRESRLRVFQREFLEFFDQAKCAARKPESETRISVRGRQQRRPAKTAAARSA